MAKKLDIVLPLPLNFGGRVVFRRSDVAALKASLIAKAMGREPPPREPVDVADEAFVDIHTLAHDLNLSVRSLWRTLAEQRGLSEAEKERAIAMFIDEGVPAAE